MLSSMGRVLPTVLPLEATPFAFLPTPEEEWREHRALWELMSDDQLGDGFCRPEHSRWHASAAGLWDASGSGILSFAELPTSPTRYALSPASSFSLIDAIEEQVPLSIPVDDDPSLHSPGRFNEWIYRCKADQSCGTDDKCDIKGSCPAAFAFSPESIDQSMFAIGVATSRNSGHPDIKESVFEADPSAMDTQRNAFLSNDENAPDNGAFPPEGRNDDCGLVNISPPNAVSSCQIQNQGDRSRCWGQNFNFQEMMPYSMEEPRIGDPRINERMNLRPSSSFSAPKLTIAAANAQENRKTKHGSSPGNQDSTPDVDIIDQAAIRNSFSSSDHSSDMPSGNQTVPKSELARGSNSSGQAAVANLQPPHGSCVQTIKSHSTDFKNETIKRRRRRTDPRNESKVRDADINAYACQAAAVSEESGRINDIQSLVSNRNMVKADYMTAYPVRTRHGVRSLPLVSPFPVGSNDPSTTIARIVYDRTTREWRIFWREGNEARYKVFQCKKYGKDRAHGLAMDYAKQLSRNSPKLPAAAAPPKRETPESGRVAIRNIT